MSKELKLDISPEERIILKSEFDGLATVEDKYYFWTNKLKRNYCFWDSYELSNIEDFIIKPADSKEIEILNKLIHEYSHIIIKSSTRLNNFFRKDLFTSQIESAIDKEALIENEIKKIDDQISNFRRIKLIPNPDQYERFQFFISGYESYYLRKEEFNWGERVYQSHLLIEKLNGIEWAKYRNYVLNSLKTNKPNESLTLNGEQKFLVLNYLELGKEIKANKQKADLFDLFIDELKATSIRPMFSDIKKFETEENLYAILKLFKSIKLNSLEIEIQNKIDKLKKKK
jgi:hypothetical protein